ncbi:MAG TPA: epimerase [Acidobacteria bacterium]|nr:epimerase [Acidobacteriota bacterium]
MDLLLLGGTRFVGRHLAEAALARGHRVTLFHRGTTNPDLFPAAEHLLGDREGDLSAFAGRRWDAVLDVNGYVPEIVRASAGRLTGAAAHYTFVSTLSVYADHTAIGRHEGSPLLEEASGESYGVQKAQCERVVEELWPGRSLVLRPGLVIGPHDFTGRFAYWPWRLARGGEVLAPGHPGLPFQGIDARDLADWAIRSLEAGRTGVFNVVGPRAFPDVPTLGELLELCSAVTGSGGRLTWVPESFLLERGVVPFWELPLWVSGPAHEGFHRLDNRKAVAAGLTLRPLAETVRATLAWLAERSGELPPRPEGGPPAPLAPEREAELLAAWRSQ